MAKNFHLVITTLFIAVLTMASKCRKDDFTIDYQYNFLEPINLYPYKKTYNIGDTIYLEHFRSDKVLFDQLSNKEVPVDSVSFEFGFILGGFPKLPTNPTDDYAGFILPDNAFISYTKRESRTYIQFPSESCIGNRTNNFKAGIILRKAGIFSLQLPNIGNLKEVRSCASIRHDNFRTASIKYKFNLLDCNKDIYLTIPQQYRCDTRDSCDKYIDNKEMFVFKVN